MDYFNYCQGLTMTNGKFDELFGGPPRRQDSRIEQRHMDLAASVQAVTEEVVMRIGRELHRETGMKNLVMAGGVALNCVANGKLLREGPFENLWIQPAAGDAGGALGAALFVWHQLLNRPRQVNGHSAQGPSLLGPAFSSDEVEAFLRRVGADYTRHSREDDLLEEVSQALVEEKAVGWFHGRMEFGPRALGARSILGDPRSPRMQATMNVKIKFRESFRPFAPCVLQEHVQDWFAMRPNEDSPYMLLVAPVLERHRVAPDGREAAIEDDPDLRRRVSAVRSSVPAITHVDYSARVQTVNEQHGRFQRLLRAFHRKSGCPILVNTSFNLSWEPIVNTPAEAYHTFMQSDMDVLVLEDCSCTKRGNRSGCRRWAESAADASNPANPWADPHTGDPLAVTVTGARNVVTGQTYPVEEGIPRLFVTNDAKDDVTEIVKQFYEKTPFPNYDDLDNRRALLEKARAGRFARLLNEQIPYGAAVVEIGCGTGQLTNFLSIAHRSVLGIDVCLNSLRLAQRFKEANSLDRGDVRADESLQTGAEGSVLRRRHQQRRPAPHGQLPRGVQARRTTGEARRIPGHRARTAPSAGRCTTRAARSTAGPASPAAGSIPQLGRISADGKREAWFQDQYCHPHESAHTLDEVFGWLDEDRFDFVNSIPKPRGGIELAPQERMFEPRDAGTAVTRFMSQLANMSSGYREGGFFIVIGQRRA